MHEVKITMLGPSGVGKTSLLTAMYEQFESNIGRTNLQIIPDLESSAILQERLAELKSLPDSFETKGWMSSTENYRSFLFELGKKGSKPSLNIHFQDYPGEWHESKSSLENKEMIESFIKESAAVIIAIDTPALMEKNGQWHTKINREQQITSLFKKAYGDLDSPRLVILAPVRCEKYLQSAESTAELLRRIKEGYAKLLDLLKVENLRTKVAVVVTPVQTVGTVVFSRIEMIDGKPHFVFRKTSHDAQYNPQDSEQPLRYLLRFLLRLHLDTRQWKFFNFLRDWLGLDNDLKRAVYEFANGCKTTGGFVLLQGETLLNNPKS
ncbi:TRAFAC clade GTPase domain-containing protein [Lyngbya aestuarii]|uniref:TRAFAC clade GTPase domain-containing protein n=1 Tax=Lyngbya aestuarii TaxID=118322 RepID=UPI00403DBE01